MKSVVVVGASLSGVRASDSILKHNSDVEVTLIGDEVHHPYNRPPLSKEALASGSDLDSIKLRLANKDGRLKLILGRSVVSHDGESHKITTDDGIALSYDALVVASGISPRRLNIPRVDRGIFQLRTYDDMVALIERIKVGEASTKRVVVLGAGFIGCEIAATLTTLGHQVTVVAPEDAPMQRPLGVVLGGEIRRRHEANGVTFLMGQLPISIEEAGSDSHFGERRLGGVTVNLSSGSAIECDLVIEAVGSSPNTSFLDSSNFDTNDGLLVDETLHAGLGVFAVGDVARYPNLLIDGVPRRIEHWGLAVDSGRYVGRSIKAFFDGGKAEPFTTLPAFWSDQFDIRLQSFGLPGLVVEPEAISLLEGELSGDCVFGYHRDNDLVGVVIVGMASEHRRLKDLVEEALSKGRTTS
ncbi:MAG: FAD/NAD(P)-binding oxidoreductase [Actinomycetota bacterium]|nr:FAD/NAD(P)-binding oxidoreductase [Actinomycetota bacterium]